MTRRLASFVVLGSLVLACDTSDGGTATDAGKDVTTNDVTVKDAADETVVPDDAQADSTVDASDSGTDASDGSTDASDASDAAPIDAGPCGKLNEVCCGGNTCADVTLSCVTGTCKHVLVVTAGAQYAINGVTAPALQLKTGVSYTFDCSQVPSIHPLIFTTSNAGGPSATPLTSNEIPGYGGVECAQSATTSVTITPDDTKQSSFFYMCHIHSFFGSSVTVSP